MPANLTPEYRKAEKEFRAAQTAEEKLQWLETMLRVIPKHKGTDHMQADLKHRIAKMRSEAVAEARHGGRRSAVKVDKEGAGQVVLLGAPNAGKSQLLAALTNASAVVADYPFSTKIPQPGMVRYEDVQIQLVDMPPITGDYLEPWAGDIVRRADGVLLLADLGDDGLLDGLDAIFQRLAAIKIEIVREPPSETPEGGPVHRRGAILANKADLPDAPVRFDILREFYAERFEIWPVSARMGTGLETIPRRLFEMLRVIRVYTKEPGRKADLEQPYTLPVGSTVIELAVKVHRDFEETLKSARVWGSGKYEGIHVKRDHVLVDRDIVELHV